MDSDEAKQLADSTMADATEKTLASSPEAKAIQWLAAEIRAQRITAEAA